MIAIVVWLAATIQLRKERRRQENHQVFKSDLGVKSDPDREEKVKKLAEALEEIIKDPKASGVNSLKVTITQNRPKT